MKSVVLNLDEELTNEQIDEIIEKLQAQKKAKVKTFKFIFSKEEKQLIQKLSTLINENIDINKYLNHNNNEDAIDDFVADYKAFIKDKIQNCKYDIDDMEDDIDINKEDIKDRQDIIKEDLKEIEKYKTEIKKIQDGFKIVEKLEKILKNKK